MNVTSGRSGDPIPTGRAIVSLGVVVEELRRGERAVLGWVAADFQQQVIPTIFISRSGISNLLATGRFSGQALNLMAGILLDRLTVQAIGRVAAHELGHYFLNSSDHEERGLMRPYYSAAELIGPSLGPFEIAVAERAVALREVARLTESQAR